MYLSARTGSFYRTERADTEEKEGEVKEEIEEVEYPPDGVDR
ncbi:MAG: hypothetical protein U9N35_04630 [Euryarchaeota archaeon]|nr:hypothetical protein [Euryarchaeota archaeon]